MWALYALFSAIAASLVAIFGKIALQSVDSTFVTTIRAIVMALFLILVSLSLRKIHASSFAALSGREWLFIVLAGIAGATSWLFYFYALKQGPATAVSAIDRLSVVFVVFFAALFLGEALTWKSVLGATAVAGGVFLMTMK